jgi:photosystem II stability/assembly factor-like uncharacterized protein
MRKIFFLILLIIAGSPAFAQPWMPSHNGPVKYLDVVAAYQRKEDAGHDKEEPKDGYSVEEDEDYQFDRWCWYWKQHLDSAGYIVGVGKTNLEWQKFKATSNNVASKTTAADSWNFVGPDKCGGGYSGLGRINVVTFDPVDSNVLYVGSAGGSAWKTTDGGNTWKSLYDDMVTLSVTDIRVNPANRNTVYVVTGDADGFGDYSVGVLKSYDGGTTWANIGPSTWSLDSFRMARALVINPLDTNELILGTNVGLYRSNNGGASWYKLNNNSYRRILFSPDDTSIVYATVELSSGAQVYRSTDGGYNWAPVTFITGAGRINIAVCPSSPAVVMALVANNNSGLLGIYRSNDHGGTFSGIFMDDASCANNLLNGEMTFPLTSCSGQAWYDLCIAIDPGNSNNVTIGGINNYYSNDGGATWHLANQWWKKISGLQVVHADKHWLEYNPLNNALYLGCDGGIYKAYAPNGNGWKDLTNGMGITQFYRNAVNNEVTFCLGGAQDNGSKKIDGSITTDLTGGDGMQCLISYSDPANIYFTATQNGYVRATYDGGITTSSITDDLPTPGAWITPYVLHPYEPSTMLIGYTQVFKSVTAGSTWAPISPVFSAGRNIEILTMAMSNQDYIYAVRDNGGSSRIHYTTNGGASWSMLTPLFSNSITDLVVDPLNEKHFWVTVSGYSSSKVFSFDLAVNTWTNESAGLPNIPVNCMVIDSFSQTKYVGTDAAVFYKTSTMTSWAPYSSNLPVVNIFDLNINHGTNEIWAATYGRGMWKSGKLELTPNSVKTIARLADNITIAPNPCKDQFTITTTGVTLRNTAVSIRLQAIDGKTVFSTKSVIDNTGKLIVNIPTLPTGIYVCEMTSEKGVARGKVVVGLQ